MSTMTRGQPPTRRQKVVDSIRARIHSGELRPGDQLDGENSLAQKYDVSRGTIRQALGELQSLNLIATHTGVGSFVTFDGVPLDTEVGWARALSEASERTITTDLRSIEPVDAADVPDLPAAVRLTRGVAVRRTRRIGSEYVSFECSTVPASGVLADLPRTGLPNGSLTDALREARLVAHHGVQDVAVRPLPVREAGILHRPAGTPFLRTVRTAYNREGDFVEHVVSFLDPERFRLRLAFGEDS